MTRRASQGSTLALRLFGPFEARVNGIPLPRLRTRKGHSLLALLALRAGREVERAWLAAMLWPESPEDQLRANLRRSLTDLRHSLGEEAVRLRSATSQTLSLDLSGASVDVVAFDEGISRGDEASLEEAVALYGGPLLEGSTEAWVFEERVAREHAYLTAVEALAAWAQERGNLAAAERHLRRALATDPLRESSHRALMEVLSASGSYAAAFLTYRECRLRLHRELNAEPDPETKALYERLLREAREKAVRGAPCAVRGEKDGAPTGPRASPVLTAHHAQRTPHGSEATLTFLFTDIEGSTQLWQEHPQAMQDALARHDAVLRHALEAHGGEVFKTLGDQFCAAFANAPDAVAAAVAAQRALRAETWGDVGPPWVRIAVHTGVAEEREGDYFGPALSRVARLLNAGHGGQVLLSLATRELVGERLPEGATLRDLGEHRLKDLVRPERAFQLNHPELPAEFPSLRSLITVAHNLPVQLTSFIGREEQIAEVKRLLPTSHLLTLTGAGGCGKTRLALQVAAELVGGEGPSPCSYADGVWLVELAALLDPGLVPRTVASAFGVREEPNRPVFETLAGYLRDRSVLVVLDNCEHLLAACARLAEALLRACPGVRILATSREGLGIAGERTYRVPSLSLPDLARMPTEEAERVAVVTQSEAVRLFAERAVFSQPGFRVGGENAAAVAQVCQRLDGIPLAIELAAARVKALPVEKIAARLDDRFRLLTGGSRTALPRQQTLRALIDWSYDLLSEPERTLLRRLSVFAGGWTLEAAEGVGAGDGIEAWNVLDLLTALVEKSLVVYEEQAAGAARYRLLETVRQYAQDRLRESREGEAVRGRHRDWYLALAEESEPDLFGEHQATWLDRWESEHDNLRVALAWALETEPVSALRLAVAVQRFWEVRGHWTEWQGVLARALERGAGAPAEVRAKGLLGAAAVAGILGDEERFGEFARRGLELSRQLGDSRGMVAALTLLGDHELGDHEEALAIAREAGDRWAAAWALSSVAQAAIRRGEDEAARDAFKECLGLAREAGDKPLVGRVLRGLGWLAERQGDRRSAHAMYQESLAINREIGNIGQVILALQCLGRIARYQGDYGTAHDLLEESLALARQTGKSEVFVRALWGLGQVAWEQGECEAARGLFQEGQAVGRELGSRDWVARCLAGLGGVAHAQGDAVAARAHLEASLAISREIGDEETTAFALQVLGDVALARGDHGAARTLLAESLTLWQKCGRKDGIGQALWRLARLAAAKDPARAARLFGAAAALRDALDAPLPPVVRPDHDRSVGAVRAALDPDAFTAAWEAGHALALEQAIAEALETGPGPRSAPGSTGDAL